MKKLKTTVTYEEREKAKEKILETIDNQFKSTAITVVFITTLLKEVISDLESENLNKQNDFRNRNKSKKDE